MKVFSLKKGILSFVLWIVAIFHIYPIFLVLISALKSKEELGLNPIGLPQNITLKNFFTAFDTMNYFKSFTNNIIILVSTIVVLTLFSTMAAYAIARNSKKKFYSGIYVFFMSGIIVPFQLTMIPLYKLMVNLTFINTFHGVVLVYLAILSPISIFIYSGFVRTVPYELEEAAYIDGCGLLKRYYYVVLPLLKPAMATVIVLNSFSIWNDFLMPTLFLNKRSMKTLVVQLYSFVGQYFNDWSLIFASIFIIVYPMMIIYVFAQKYIIQGITAGAIKG